jgi:hypothetical protein
MNDGLERTRKEAVFSRHLYGGSEENNEGYEEYHLHEIPQNFYIM